MSGYVIKVTLNRTKPPVWRRIVIPEHISLFALHKVIQASFGWNDLYRHHFEKRSSNWHTTVVSQGMTGEVVEGDMEAGRILAAYGRISYLYDYEMNWSHAVVLEEKDMAYNLPYAKVLKAVGDNYDGELGDLSYISSLKDGKGRIPFVMEACNRTLENLDYSVKNDTMEELHARMKAKSVLHKRNKAKETASSAWKKLQDLGGDLSDMMDMDPSVKQSIHEKMFSEFMGREHSLDGEILRMTDMLLNDGHTVFRCIKGMALETVEEMQKGESLQGSRENARFFGIDVENTLDLKEYGKKITECYLSHPEYVLLILEEDELAFMEDLLKKKEGFIFGAVKLRTLVALVQTGLITVEKKNDLIAVYPASDLKKYLTAFKKTDGKKLWKKRDRVGDNLYKLVFVYGIISLNEIYDLYVAHFGKDCGRTMLLRILYLYVRNDYEDIVTFSSDDDFYVGCSSLDIDYMTDRADVYGKDLEYAHIRNSVITNLDSGLNISFPVLTPVIDTVRAAGVKAKLFDATEVLYACVTDMMSGKPLEEVLESLGTVYSGLSEEERNTMRYVLLDAMMRMPLGMLKGWSRMDYSDEKNVDPFTLDVFENPDDPENIALSEFYREHMSA